MLSRYSIAHFPAEEKNEELLRNILNTHTKARAHVLGYSYRTYGKCGNGNTCVILGTFDVFSKMSCSRATLHDFVCRQVKLAVSLHAANDRERGELLPVNRRFPLSDLMGACREYVDVSGRRMTFEWALIQGENDSPEVCLKE